MQEEWSACPQTLEGRSDWVNSIAFSHDSTESPKKPLPVKARKQLHYTYQPLSGASEIRLIKLYPYRPSDGARSNRTDPLSPLTIDFTRCQIDRPTNKIPPFHAISYTWGPPKWDTILTSGGELVTTTERVRGILESLRPEACDEPSYVWIDQLCINQKDEEEKLRQIRIMRDIYAAAAATSVVLSRNHESANRLILAINAAGLLPLFEFQGFLDISPTDRASLGMGLVRAWSSSRLEAKVKVFFSNECVITDLEAVLSDPVFRRAWIYQEIVSSKSVHLATRIYRLDLNVFARVFQLYIRLKNEALRIPLEVPLHLRAMDMIIHDRISHHAGRLADRPAKDWMRLHVEAQGLLLCTDAHDHTFALTTFQEFYKDIPPSGYSIKIADLYTKVTKSMIFVSRSLDVFGGLSGEPHTRERRDEGMPSWVPDWSRERGNIPFYWPLDWDDTLNAAAGREHDPFDSPFEAIEGRKVLVVRGMELDTVQHVFRGHEFEAFQGEDITLEDFFNLRGFVQALDEFSVSKYGLGLVSDPALKSPLSKAATARALMEMMTASMGSLLRFTEDNWALANIPDAMLDEMVYMAGCKDLICCQNEVSLAILAPMYGGVGRAMAKVRQWGSICLGRHVAFGRLNNNSS